jgi:serine/threonine protein kinase/tetratricopeptide (TPR) repeat protein
MGKTTAADDNDAGVTLSPARTHVAGGAVPPRVPAPPAATPAANDLRSQAETLVGGIDRRSRVGTQIRGAETLAPPAGDAPRVRLTAGKLVPGTRYRIVRWLGEGGMGVVYEAEHVDIERRVALKILRFDLSKQPRMVKVFRDEAKAASRLGSRYLIEVYDFGELMDGRLFFAMELLQGDNLVPEGDAVMEPDRLIPILRQMAKGLHVAHQAGVVHRDVKPENIISIVDQGRPDTIKIVDFGISAMLAAGQEQGGGISGTPHYMSPEQITGDPFDGRLDIYALGCTAYELLTGRPPFESDSIENLIYQQINTIAPRPSDVRKDLHIPRPLEDVILRCLEKNPQHRYADMADLEAALCEAQIAMRLHTAWDDLPLPELPDAERRDRLLSQMPSPLEIAGPRRRSWLWPVVAAISSLAAVSLALMLAFGRGPTDEDESTVEQLVADARGAAARSNWLYPAPDNPDMPTAFTKILELEALEGTAAALAAQRSAELRGEFAEALVIYGDKLWKEGAKVAASEFYWWALAFDEGNEHAYERAGATPGRLQDFVARAHDGRFNEAELVIGLGLAARAQEDDETRQQMLDAFVEASEAVQLPLSAMSALRESGLDLPTRRSDAPRAVEPSVNTPSVRPETADIGDVVADENDENHENDEVVIDDKDAKSQTHAKRRKVAAPVLGEAERDPARATQLADQGTVALRAGRRQEAASLFHQAISFDRRNATALMGLSDVYFDTGSSQKAVVYAEKAVAASPANSTARLKLGDAYFNVLRYKDALEQYEKAGKLGSSRAAERIVKVKAKLGH